MLHGNKTVRTLLVESRKESNDSDTNWLSYLFFIIKLSAGLETNGSQLATD